MILGIFFNVINCSFIFVVQVDNRNSSAAKRARTDGMLINYINSVHFFVFNFGNVVILLNF